MNINNLNENNIYYELTNKQKSAIENMNNFLGKGIDVDSIFFKTKKHFQEYFDKLQKQINKKKYFDKNKKGIKKEWTVNKLVFLGEKLTEKYGYIYSEGLLKDKFYMRIKNDDIINQAIEELKRKNIINDERFVKKFIMKQIYKGKGFYWIVQKLKEKKYYGDILNIYNELNVHTIENQNYKFLFSKLKDKFDLSNIEERTKFIKKLQSKGYSYKNIKKDLDNLDIKITYKKEVLSKEKKYKIINKYLKKYKNHQNDIKEKTKLINNLKLNGFSWEEIKSYL